MKISAMISRVLYIVLAKNLPMSTTISFFGWARTRLATSFAPEISPKANIEKGAVFSSKVSVSEYGNIGERARLQGKVTIGRYVMMGPDCNIWTINHKTEKTDVPMCFQGDADEEPVVIEDDVWIGSRVTILPGVHIGKGSIIGAGSVVSKDVPDYSIVVGNPAIVVRSRIKPASEVIE